MPISGPSSPPKDDGPYFKSLDELDSWFKTPHERLDGVLPYVARTSEPESSGRLLLCHDYKGGYTENLHEMGYTFNFWSKCTTFIYFSHHRITVPPPGWVNAAHRQGAKMLGTIIFEHESSEADCLRLIVGKLPSTSSASVKPQHPAPSLPLSPHYAVLLAELAAQRGFDGYLVNVECPLKGRFDQTQAFAAWMTILQDQMRKRVGPHAETIWYDSVIIDGRLAWQDRLNSLNLPFFLSSTGFFTNYTWRNEYPNAVAQYFLSLDSSILGGTGPRGESQKTLRDIYMGVDVWGRGSHGGGGFGSYKAISHIAPESLGLSVALFGQAWSWETEQDKPGFTWETWWQYDRKLWVGTARGEPEVTLPEAPQKKGEMQCTHGPFVPVSSFFPRYQPPDPLRLAFHTSFCPGVGRSWFVEGKDVYKAGAHGWTDIDKQTSLGDLVWPKPASTWDGGDWEGEEEPLVLPELDFHNAWSGSSSLQLQVNWKGSESENATYRCIWVPVQSLSLTVGQLYDATLIYKNTSKDEDGLLEIGFAFRGLQNQARSISITPLVENQVVANGWTKLSIRLAVEGSACVPTAGALGLIIALFAENTSDDIGSTILLGQIDVHPTQPDTLSKGSPQILWVDYQLALISEKDKPTNTNANANANANANIYLNWQVAASYPALFAVPVKTADDPICAWKPHPSYSWFPKYLYFNIYAKAFSADKTIGSVEDAAWLGTSDIDGWANKFVVVRDNLEKRIKITKGGRVRFYIQGVLDTGEVLGWEKCVCVDVNVPVGAGAESSKY